ncbi:MAG: hypothetical protein ACOYB0_08335 [Polynucleobacter sp.]
MAYRYAIEYTTGMRQEFSANLFYEAKQCQNYEGARFFLSGVEVDAAAWFADIDAREQAAYDRKNKTHKRVRVLHGASVACYVTKWVKR